MPAPDIIESKGIKAPEIIFVNEDFTLLLELASDNLFESVCLLAANFC